MEGMTGQELEAVQGLSGEMGTTLLFGLILYLYFAVMVMALARKTGTPNAWMAWIPILNVLLMCRIGGRPGWWLLLLLIPFLNMIIFAMIWGGIARARGKPVWTGILMCVPPLGFLLPIYLLAGAATGSAKHEAAGSAVGSVAASAASSTPSACSACGEPLDPGDAFCGECGQALQPAVAPEVATVEPAQSSSHKFLSTVLVTVIVIGLGFGARLLFKSLSGVRGADRVAVEMPQRTAGTLTEFPVDTEIGSPAAPVSVVTKNLEDGGVGAQSEIPADWLPPGLESGSLPRHATGVTSAVYRTNPEEPPVNVHVLNTPQGSSSARAITSEVARATGGRTSPVQVESPKGEVYTGSKIESAEVLIYVLTKLAANITIIVFAPEPAAMPVATRLAGNVGNGEGLIDYPELTRSLWVLPPALPGELTLQEMNTVTPEELGLSTESAGGFLGGEVDPEVQQILEQVRFVIPRRITAARYLDLSGQDWNVLVGSYDSRFRAWSVWLVLRGMLGLGEMDPVSVRGVGGLVGDTGEGEALVFQQGPFILLLQAPPATPTDRLIELAEGFQI